MLRRTADYFKKAKSFTVDVDREQKLGAQSMKATMGVAVERPNKLAVRTHGGGMDLDLVSDGKTLSVSIPPVKRYVQSKAPAALTDLGGDPITQSIVTSILQGTLLSELISDDPYKSLMDGVKTSAYVGEEVLDGVKTHHVKFTQDQFDWEVWVPVEGDPLPRKAVVDMTKTIANTPAAAQLKGQKFEMIQVFKGWKVGAAPDEKAFAFQPPAGFQKAESLMEALTGGAGAGREEVSPLVGKPAPDVRLKMLEKGEFMLKNHRDKDVVMLDFWATWCGPCVQELPILTQVAESYKGKGVAFFAINLNETPEQVKKFQDERKLKFPVALDTDGAVGTAYSANAIPLLVLIDKKGIVQSVHVGYNPSIKATLTKELDALLAGKSLPKEPAPADQAKAEAPKSEGLEPVWSASGDYVNVATDPKGRSIYAIQRRDRCDVLDLAGKPTRTFALEVAEQGMTVRPARQPGGADGFFAFRVWGHALAALKADGKKMWDQAGGDGVDDVWAADLDGDGADEMIVGYNGGTGLHVFSPEGKRVWKRTDFGNVWNVTAGDIDGDGKLEVINTSAQGKVHVSAAKDGAPVATLDSGIYATKVRVAHGRAKAPAKGDLILVVGSTLDQKRDAIAALGGDGKVLWTTKLPSESASGNVLAVSPDGTRAAVSFQHGLVCVVDLANGKILGQVTGQGFTPTVAWAVRGEGGENLLLVAGNFAVHAFRVKAGAVSPGNP